MHNETTGSLAALLNAELSGPSDLPITGVSSLDSSAPGMLTFIRSPEFARKWSNSAATAAVVTSGLDVPGHDPAVRSILFVEDADLAMIRLLEHFAPAIDPVEPGISPDATIHASARVDPSATVGPCCVLEKNVTVAARAHLVAQVYLGAGASVGPDTTLHAGVSIQNGCSIGAHCVLHNGVVIGADGFGFRPDPSGHGLVKIPHIGTVEIGNHIEIGANSAVDRGKFGATKIGDGTKIDNLVQIGHNANIGRAVVICGCSGIAGSVTIGDGVLIGAAGGVSDGVTIGAGARIAAKAGVMSDVEPGITVMGYPAIPVRDYLRTVAASRRLPRLLKYIKPRD